MKNTNIYTNIKRLAKSQKIPIGKIEKDCEVTPRYICTWNKTTPNPFVLAKVASYLGTTVEELLK